MIRLDWSQEGLIQGCLSILSSIPSYVHSFSQTTPLVDNHFPQEFVSYFVNLS